MPDLRIMIKAEGQRSILSKCCIPSKYPPHPLWARWLRNPCRLGDPHRFRAGGKIRSGPLVGKVAT